MKKLSLTGAALLCFAALTHAQINQSGAFQYAEQNRTGNNQTGSINQLQGNADRTNFGNYAITFQTAPGDGGTNTANINQNNGSQGNRAGITQQGGAGNLAQLDQNGGVYGLSGGASSTSATIGRAGELGNFAGIAQQGSNNTAFLSQSNLSQLNGSEIYQNGTSNKGLVDQVDNSSSNLGFIFQGYTGQGQPGLAINNARANINQNGPNALYGGLGESTRNIATITQLSDEVYGRISQGNIPVRFLNDAIQAPFPSSAGVSRDNIATIEQQVRSNNSFAFITQGQTGGESSGSSAYILQTNQYNRASISQGTSAGDDFGSTARISQAGAGYPIVRANNTEFRFNNTNIFQGNFLGTSFANQAIIDQTSDLTGDTQSSISQGVGPGAIATRNQAFISQAGRATTTNSIGILIAQGSSSQMGSGRVTSQDNQATITQGVGVINGNLRIDQGSNDGSSIVEANRNVAGINQIRGINGQARIGQGTDIATYSNGIPTTTATRSLNGIDFGLGTIARDNRADIIQARGDGNYALLLQSGEQNIGRIVQQAQDNNFATIVQTQNANRSIATINQLDGSANQATIQQFGSADGNVSIGTADQAIINQFRGSNNIAFLQQGAPGVSTSGGNYAILTQNGNANKARFLQQGVGNFVSITQNGDGNEIRNGAGDANSYGSQVGNNNNLRLVQNGSTNRIFSYTQVGNNNTQVVSQ